MLALRTMLRLPLAAPLLSLVACDAGNFTSAPVLPVFGDVVPLIVV